MKSIDVPLSRLYKTYLKRILLFTVRHLFVFLSNIFTISISIMSNHIVANSSYIGQKGYTIPKSCFTEDQLKELKESLILRPMENHGMKGRPGSGTNDIKMKDVELILCKHKGCTSGIDMLSIHDRSKWKHFNLSDSVNN